MVSSFAASVTRPGRLPGRQLRAGVHAIPMRLRDQVIGTLNLFRGAVNGLDPAVGRRRGGLVDVATIGILQERAVRQQEIVAGQLQVALNSRVMIEQGQGHPG